MGCGDGAGTRCDSPNLFATDKLQDWAVQCISKLFPDQAKKKKEEEEEEELLLIA